MKKIIIPILALLAFSACSPEEYKDITPPANNITNLTGQWKLGSVVQKDEGAEIKNSPFVTMDITNLFPFTESGLTLSSTNGQPTTYSYVKGNAPAIITAPTGNWKVDNLAAPKKIWFIGGTDTTTMEFGSMPRSFDAAFSLKIVKIDQESKKPAISYSYRFTKN
jgi:Domain of unknown function (DUF5004)